MKKLIINQTIKLSENQAWITNNSYSVICNYTNSNWDDNRIWNQNWSRNKIMSCGLSFEFGAIYFFKSKCWETNQ